MAKPVIKTRAPRFSLRLPIRYRTVGEPRWHDGITENISRSGVLFQAESELLVDTAIEMRVVLPVAGEVERSLPEILCQGHVVRTIIDRQQARRPALAAAITDYRIRGDNPGTSQ